MDLEVELDRFLKIKTNGRDDSNSNFINYPYEATPYVVLQELANSGYICKKDKIIDYGCGKGRVSYYLAYSVKSQMIGVEYDPRLYNSALENKKTALSQNRVEFFNIDAKEFKVSNDITGAYFFNPFSVEILKEVLKNIRESLKQTPREFKLFFYYISNEFIEFLEKENIELHEIIDCAQYFSDAKSRENISIYKIF